jgi:hypothetical protein
MSIALFPKRGRGGTPGSPDSFAIGAAQPQEAFLTGFPYLSCLGRLNGKPLEASLVGYPRSAAARIEKIKNRPKSLPDKDLETKFSDFSCIRAAAPLN